MISFLLVGKWRDFYTRNDGLGTLFVIFYNPTITAKECGVLLSCQTFVEFPNPSTKGRNEGKCGVIFFVSLVFLVFSWRTLTLLSEKVCAN